MTTHDTHQDPLDQLDELLALRAETQELTDEADRVHRGIADRQQQADMATIDRTLTNPVRAVALLHISAKRGVTLEPGASAELCNTAIRELDAMDIMLDDMGKRVMQTSPECHQAVRAWSAKMEQTMGKLGACVARMQQSFS